MIDWHDLAVGEHRITCPDCGRSPKDRTCGVTVEHGGGVAHCFRCGYVEAHRDERTHHRTGAAVPRPAAQSKRETLSEWGRKLWNACGLVSGPALAYLEARCCAIPPADGDLRWHAELQHPSGYVGAALVALVTDAVTREPLTLHRTWIKSDGTKAACDPPRMLLGGHRKAGGVIRLWPDEAVGYGLGVAEGIESALTLASVLTPVWSCIDAGNLAQFPVLLGVEVLTIAADNDKAGLAAARECASRWSAADAIARIVVAPREGADLNDFAREVGHEG